MQTAATLSLMRPLLLAMRSGSSGTITTKSAGSAHEAGAVKYRLSCTSEQEHSLQELITQEIWK